VSFLKYWYYLGKKHLGIKNLLPNNLYKQIINIVKIIIDGKIIVNLKFGVNSKRFSGQPLLNYIILLNIVIKMFLVLLLSLKNLYIWTLKIILYEQYELFKEVKKN